MSTDLAPPQQTEEREPKKPSGEILQQEVQEGQSILERSTFPLLVSALSAGLDIGFSLFLMALMRTLAEGQLPRPTVELLVANMYAVGFIFVVLGRSELFTEQTTLAVLAVLNRRASVLALLRAWGVVYVGNIIGAAAFAWAAVLIGPAMGIIEPRTFGDIATTLTAHNALTIFLSAVLAGWLMGLLSWLVTASRDTISQIAIVWLIATVIGLAHLHHVVVGSAEVLAGIFAGQGVTLADYGHFLLWTTLGNAVGGPFFVALIKTGHASEGVQ